MSKNACCLLRPQKLSAATSSLAPSSLLAVRSIRCSSVTACRVLGDSVPTLWRTSLISSIVMSRSSLWRTDGKPPLEQLNIVESLLLQHIACLTQLQRGDPCPLPPICSLQHHDNLYLPKCLSMRIRHTRWLLCKITHKYIHRFRLFMYSGLASRTQTCPK